MLIRSINKKVMLALSIVLIFTVIATACSSKPADNNDNTPTSPASTGSNAPATDEAAKTDPKDRITIRVTRSGNPPADLTVNNPAVKYLQDKLDVNMEYQMYPSNIYAEKIRVQLAGGDIPDAFVWNAGLDGLIVSLIQANKIVPLDEYIDKYPGLKSLKDYYRVRYDGKIWAVTGARHPATTNDIPVIRQDWLDNLNLKAPTTTDELMEVATAFTKDDPDKNGVNDTFGIILGNNFLEPALSGSNGIAQAFGLDNAYMKQPDGSYVPQLADPRFKEYLAWMQEAYKRGAIDPDFTTSSEPGAKLVSTGQAGIAFNYVNVIYEMEDPTGYKQKDPKAQLVPFEPVKGPHGDQGAKSRVSLAGIYISKEAAKDQAKMDKIMEWLEWGITDEGTLFGTYGVEGVHYTKDAAGNVSPDATAVKRDEPSLLTYTKQVEETKNVNANKGYSEEAQAAVSRAALLVEPHLKYSDTSEAYSPTETKYRSEIQSFIVENVSKAIVGHTKIEDWDKVIEEWYKRFEGDKIVQEKREFMESFE